MKKFLPVIIIAVIAFAIFGWAKGFYNKAIEFEETIGE